MSPHQFVSVAMSLRRFYFAKICAKFLERKILRASMSAVYVAGDRYLGDIRVGAGRDHVLYLYQGQVWFDIHIPHTVDTKDYTRD